MPLLQKTVIVGPFQPVRLQDQVILADPVFGGVRLEEERPPRVISQKDGTVGWQGLRQQRRVLLEHRAVGGANL